MMELPPGDRFFARIKSADLECPKCGNIYLIGATGKAKRGYYDSKTSRFRCPHCGLVLVLGVIGWLPQRGRPLQGPPRDQVPTPRQALAMRRKMAGHWSEERLERKAPANRIVEEEE